MEFFPTGGDLHFGDVLVVAHGEHHIGQFVDKTAYRYLRRNLVAESFGHFVEACGKIFDSVGHMRYANSVPVYFSEAT